MDVPVNSPKIRFLLKTNRIRNFRRLMRFSALQWKNIYLKNKGDNFPIAIQMMERILKVAINFRNASLNIKEEKVIF